MATNAVGGGAIDAEGFLKVLLHTFRTGYTKALNVTQRGAGANMSVDVNVDSSSFGGALFATSAAVPYFGYTNAAINSTVTTADPTNPRKDIVVAYIDLSLITTSSTNNLSAFKVKVVPGTAAASPADPSGATIQASIGAGYPYVSLARVDVAAAAASIVNANITDLRTPAALSVPYLYGGSSNTKGHLVPNISDDTVALLNAVQTFIGKSVSLTGNTSTGNVLTNPYKFSVYRAGAQNTGAGADAIVNFDTKTYDTSSNVDVVTNKGRFTAPVAGFYQFTSKVGSASGSYLAIGLYKNSTLLRYGTLATSSSGSTGAMVSSLEQLAAGDYVEVYCQANIAKAVDLGPTNSYFSGFLVSHL